MWPLRKWLKHKGCQWTRGTGDGEIQRDGEKDICTDWNDWWLSIVSYYRQIYLFKSLTIWLHNISSIKHILMTHLSQFEYLILRFLTFKLTTINFLSNELHWQGEILTFLMQKRVVGTKSHRYPSRSSHGPGVNSLWDPLSYSTRWNRCHLCLYWVKKEAEYLNALGLADWFSKVGWISSVQLLYSESPSLSVSFLSSLSLSCSHWRLLGFFSSWFMFQLKTKKMSRLTHKRWYDRSRLNCCNWDLIISEMLLSSAA